MIAKKRGKLLAEIKRNGALYADVKGAADGRCLLQGPAPIERMEEILSLFPDGAEITIKDGQSQLRYIRGPYEEVVLICGATSIAHSLIKKKNLSLGFGE